MLSTLYKLYYNKNVHTHTHIHVVAIIKCSGKHVHI